jgi:hypothetical protein
MAQSCKAGFVDAEALFLHWEGRSFFMFQLTQQEFDALRSQIVISKGKGE